MRYNRSDTPSIPEPPPLPFLRQLREDARLPYAQRRWRQLRQGTGQHIVGPDGLRLLLPSARQGRYSNAQFDDAHDSWRPPVQMSLRVRIGGTLSGTAGFGFWNNPLAGGMRLPSAAWFFHAAPPSDLPLALGVPGSGWKVATIDMHRPAAWALAPLALPVALANNIPALRRRIWPRVQRVLRIDEHPIVMPHERWCTCQILWQTERVCFIIDDTLIFATDCSPHGPLGCVIWLDNQWALVDPAGRFGWGTSDGQHQTLTFGNLRIQTL